MVTKIKGLMGYTDTKAEALKRQRTLKKSGIATKIKYEYGGYAVYKDKNPTITKRPISRRRTNLFGGFRI
jgi:hypothetical protein